MREIPKKNYIILAILILVTVIITIGLSKLYLDNAKTATVLYDYLNKMDKNELNDVSAESTYLIVYVADKYGKSYNKFEKEFKKQIEKYNLRENVVFFDKEAFDESFIKDVEKGYNVKIDRSKIDKNIIFEFSDQKLINIVYINPNSDALTVIDYEELK